MTYNVIIFTGGLLPLSMKPFGAYKVAHELRLAGFSTLVINHVETFGFEELKNIIAKTVGDNTLFVGFSNTFFGLSGQEESSNTLKQVSMHSLLPYCSQQEETELCAYIKSLNANIKLVIGGARVRQDISNPNIDYAFISYSDQSVVNFAQHLATGSLLLKARKNLSKIVVVDDDLAKDFDFASSSMCWTEDDIVLPGETLPLEISRGCVFSCKFCSFRLNGKQALDYLKNYNNIRNELIANYENYGITHYRFVDDTFNDTEEKIDAMLAISESLPFRLKFWAYIRLDLLATKPHTIHKLYRMGLRSAFFGIETLNKKTGLLIGKGYDSAKLVSTINYIKETYGDQLHLHGSFICGLPEESFDSVNNTMERLLSREIKLDSYNFNALVIVKGTSSAFGLNMQQHGYNEDATIGVANSKFAPWKSKYMDFQQAKAHVDKFMQLSIEQQRFDNSDTNKKLQSTLQGQAEIDQYIDRYKAQLYALLDKRTQYNKATHDNSN